MRNEWGRVLAALINVLGDFDKAEDALQDAVVAALKDWAAQGIPDNPRAWLLQVARRKAIDRFRREQIFETRRTDLEQLYQPEQLDAEQVMGDGIPDERLRLIFTCCHPALSEQAQVALTLRTLGGLTTTELARAYLIPEVTMAQRIVRAKRKIKAANIPYRVPPPERLTERVGSVLSVIYLIFNEGYAASSGQDLTRIALSGEAIRLGEMLHALMPREPEVAGLLALMLLHDSRKPARIDEDGNFVALEKQQRGLWNYEQIKAGLHLLEKAGPIEQAGPYQLQAAISAVHAQAADYQDTDWHRIILLYDQLYAIQPSPVVKLNAVVALSMVQGPASALEVLERVEAEGKLDRYQPFHVVKANLLKSVGQKQAAAEAYRLALSITHNRVERDFLQHCLKELEGCSK